MKSHENAVKMRVAACTVMFATEEDEEE